jgi:hypothetical protein
LVQTLLSLNFFRRDNLLGFDVVGGQLKVLGLSNHRFLDLRQHSRLLKYLLGHNPCLKRRFFLLLYLQFLVLNHLSLDRCLLLSELDKAGFRALGQLMDDCGLNRAALVLVDRVFEGLFYLSFERHELLAGRGLRMFGGRKLKGVGLGQLAFVRWLVG